MDIRDSLSFTRLRKTNYLTRQSVFDKSVLRFNYFHLKVTFNDKLNFIKENLSSVEHPLLISKR